MAAPLCGLSLVVLLALAGCSGGNRTPASASSTQSEAQPSPPKNEPHVHHNPQRSASRHRANRKVLVPSVIGDQPATAKTTLVDHGFLVRLIPSTLGRESCGSRVAISRVAPVADSQVVSQWPDAGSHIGVGRHIDLSTNAYVQNDCPAPASLPPCSPDQLSLEVKPDYPDTAGGSELGQLTAIIRNIGSQGTCRLASTIETTIGAPAGTVPSAISGDPATLILGAALPPGQELHATWVWDGPWCGDRSAVGSASVAGLSETAPMGKYQPTCYHSGHSRLGAPSLAVYRNPPGG